MCLAAEDFSQAAKIQAQLALLGASADPLEIEALRVKIKTCVGEGDYAKAAMFKEEIAKLEKEVVSGFHTAQPSATVVLKLAEVCEVGRALPSVMCLQNVRVLSMSPLSENPKRGNGKGKPNGKDKAKQKGNGKSKERDDCRVMYVGDAGYVACIMAFVKAASMSTEDYVGCLVDITSVKPRQGQLGIIEATAETLVSKRFESVRSELPCVFPYFTENVDDHFATMDHARRASINTHVDIVVRCTIVEERTKDDGESYLIVYGVDMDGATVGPLRMWRFCENNAHAQNIYIVRGLKVVADRQWSDHVWDYVTCTDGSKQLQCDYRTAIEDVTHNLAITSIFE